jgi:hypothetical protein
MALELVLKPLGTSLRHYMPASKAAAIEAMRGVLAVQDAQSREQCAKNAEAANTHYAAEQAAARARGQHSIARDFESMRIAAAGIATAIRGESA